MVTMVPAMLALAMLVTPKDERREMQEAACVSALADRLTIHVDEFRVLGSRWVGKLTRVKLKAEGQSLYCFISDLGEIVDVRDVRPRRR